MMTETMAYLESRQKKDPLFKYEVIIVNDGSPDKTAEEALKFVRKYGAEKVRLLDLAKNRGKGGAVRMVSGTSDHYWSQCVCVHACTCLVPISRGH